MQELWDRVDDYVGQVLVKESPHLRQAVANSSKQGMPAIQVSAAHGKFLGLLVRLMGASRVLEIGTLGGYSTIWMAKNLPDSGYLLSLEVSEQHAETARLSIEQAGLSKVVEVACAPATQTLSKLCAEGVKPFDLIFIDADKENYPSYLEYAIKLSRSGSVIVGDNALWRGKVAMGAANEEIVQQLQKFNQMVGDDSRLMATALQTVGHKGYDGFAIALVK